MMNSKLLTHIIENYLYTCLTLFCWQSNYMASKKFRFWYSPIAWTIFFL